MRLQALQLLNWRNIDQLQLRLDAPVTVLHGDNGQGKTNILEAIYFAACGNSFRSHRILPLLQVERQSAKVLAWFTRQNTVRCVEVQLSGNRRILLQDSQPLQHRVELLSWSNVSLFEPHTVDIVQQGPELRRRFIDRACALGNRDFVAHNLAYYRLLTARNALLRQGLGASQPIYLETLNAQLSEHGAQIHAQRQAFVQVIAPWSAAIYAQLSQQSSGCKPFTLSLSNGLRRNDAVFAQSYRQALAMALEQALPVDSVRGFTSVGPHRADLHLLLGGREARQYASQGEQRSMALALKLAELQYLQATMNDSALFLLDDASSLLDAKRWQAFLELVVDRCEHVVLTATNPTSLCLPNEVRAETFAIVNGTLAVSSQRP